MLFYETSEPPSERCIILAENQFRIKKMKYAGRPCNTSPQEGG